MGFSRREYWSGLPFPSPPHQPISLLKARCPTIHSPTPETSLTGLNWPSIHLSLTFLFFFFFPLHLEELFSYRTYFEKQCLKYSFSVSLSECGSRNVLDQATLSREVLRRFETEFEHITIFNMFFTILAR